MNRVLTEVKTQFTSWLSKKIKFFIICFLTLCFLVHIFTQSSISNSKYQVGNIFKQMNNIPSAKILFEQEAEIYNTGNISIIIVIIIS